MTYFFDGTKNGFLTAFVKAFSDGEAIVTSRKIQLLLGSEPIVITTDEGLSKKAVQRLSAYDYGAIKELDLLLRCGDEDAEQTAFLYLREIAKHKRAMRKQLSISYVFSAMENLKKIRYEIHRFHGFIRFTETASGALYAPFSPDNDICDLLVPHFRARLPQYPFVLHDVGRKKAAVYDGYGVFLAPLGEAEIVLATDEDAWRALFKRYYAAVNIPSRKKLKQMKGYMPVRYWKFLTEKQT